MAVRLSSLIAQAALNTQADSWYSFLLAAESTQGHSAAGKIRQFYGENNPMTSSRIEPATFQLVA
jgi:hypothetical protein